ncbi:MAG: DUF2934 domain-containing protein [Opitutaceae bacterium]
MKTSNHRIHAAPAGAAPSHDAIERLAYQLWQRKGCPAGSNLECWLEAEHALASRAQRSIGIRRQRRRQEAREMDERLHELLAASGVVTDPRSPTSL